MKKRLGVALAVLMAGAMLAGCGSSGGQTPASEAGSTQTKASEAPASEAGGDAAADSGSAEIVLKAGEVNPEDHIMGRVLNHFSELVSEKSNGRIKVEVYAGGQLGDERTEMQAIQMGALDIFRANTLTAGDFGANKMNLFALPYLFRDRDHLWTVLKSDLGRELLSDIQESGTGMVAISYTDEGSRNFFTKKPVEKPEDLKGMKIRVSETSILMDTMKCFGANPTPISYSELYTSLQTGVVDGADQPLAGYASNSFDEVAGNMILDGHTYSPGLIVVSEITWNKLSAEDQAILKEAAAETEDYNKEIAQEDDDKILEQLKADGANMIEVPDKKPWQDMVQPVYDTYAKDYMDIVEEIQGM